MFLVAFAFYKLIKALYVVVYYYFFPLMIILLIYLNDNERNQSIFFKYEVANTNILQQFNLDRIWNSSNSDFWKN